ncbi:MAG TPA: 6-phosphofructokinase [Segeticoccus sp.]|uniref:6-phosphofructokinase n=1 Tax=Segeticoccus sp. TaxID=2706531 RepID=UPI002D80EE11|nr:6-phosphofructokinase [Segeticoccus sp.]HET8600297.1 6-phosphofructokinase [Segeticoccus sp.]
MRIGVLTGGGDCPGLNAVIRAVVTKGTAEYGHEFVGFLDGWRGPLKGLTRPLTAADVADLVEVGGTVLGSSRTNPYSVDGGLDRIRHNLEDAGVDALIALGGEDTLGVAKRLTDDGFGVVGVPKTIDNDLSATDYTFGFDTAVSIAAESIDRLRTTAQSHHRTMVVEVMGRHAGWIALHSGMATGANVILIPEQDFDLGQVCRWVEACHARGVAPIVVAAEGAQPAGGAESLKDQERDAFGHVRLGGIGDWLAEELEERTGMESRSVVLGHLQRGGTPTAYDRVLSTRLGLHAIDAAHERDFGTMVALRGTDIVRVSLAEATGALKTVSPERYAEAATFFG